MFTVQIIWNKRKFNGDRLSFSRRICLVTLDRSYYTNCLIRRSVDFSAKASQKMEHGRTRTYRKLPKRTGNHRRLPNRTEHHRTLPNMTEHHWTLTNMTEHYRTLPNRADWFSLPLAALALVTPKRTSRSLQLARWLSPLRNRGLRNRIEYQNINI